MNAIELLVSQHRELEQKLASLLGESAAGRRTSQLRDVLEEFGRHVATEEEIFYPSVMSADKRPLLLESLEEHLSLKRLLADLEALDPADETWRAKVQVLDEQTRHHHAEEEEHLFPSVIATSEPAALERLGVRIEAAQASLSSDASAASILKSTDTAMPLP